MALLAASRQAVSLPPHPCAPSPRAATGRSSSSIPLRLPYPQGALSFGSTARLRRGAAAAGPVMARGRSDVRSWFLGQWQGKAHLGQQGCLALPLLAGAPGQEWVRGRAPARGPRASLFGVGAPEALVIGVVALIVFGPKGLAEVARNLGKTLRAFQPTIRELQEVTKEFKDTLQQEIGLDELRSTPPPARSAPTPSSAIAPAAPAAASAQAPSPAAPDTASPTPQAYTADDIARVTEEQIKKALEANTLSEEARRASEIAAWKGTPPATAVSTAAQIPAPVIDSTLQEKVPDAVKVQSASAPKPEA